MGTGALSVSHMTNGQYAALVVICLILAFLLSGAAADD
jgi:hypothetical protein